MYSISVIHLFNVEYRNIFSTKILKHRFERLCMAINISDTAYFLINLNEHMVIQMSMERNLCSICKGSRRLCGRPQCPILLRLKSYRDVVKKLESKENIFGSSPPGILVGEWGYPKINVGGLIPPVTGEDASFFDAPQSWAARQVDLEEVIKLRASLIHSKFSTDIKAPRRLDSKLLEEIQQLALSDRPTDTEVYFKKRPKIRFNFDGIVTPVGISASVKDMRVVDNPHIPRKVDYLSSDTNLKAQEAMMLLYKSKIPIYQIIRLLSVGLLGFLSQRKLVPTRWAITAADKTISDQLVKKIKKYPLMNEILVFRHEYLGNHYELLFIPRIYSFEMIEIWLPRSVWVTGEQPAIYNVYEFYDAKANIMDGGYYAIRLPVMEYLDKIRRQATIIAIREIKPSYFAPVGNWQIRENVRLALKDKPEQYQSLDEAIDAISKRIITQKDLWLNKSQIVNFLKKQKQLDEFF